MYGNGRQPFTCILQYLQVKREVYYDQRPEDVRLEVVNVSFRSHTFHTLPILPTHCFFVESEGHATGWLHYRQVGSAGIHTMSCCASISDDIRVNSGSVEFRAVHPIQLPYQLPYLPCTP